MGKPVRENGFFIDNNNNSCLNNPDLTVFWQLFRSELVHSDTS